MDGFLPRFRWGMALRLAMLPVLAGGALPAAAQPAAARPAQEADLPLAWRDDADLADVFFADERHGWAVGDRGVVWHTADGGRNWRLQPSGTDGRLEAVHFVDRRHGWIAGGRWEPYVSASRGVLLRTRDGGTTWQPQQRLPIAYLRGIKFFTPATGFAWGEPSALFPGGLATTSDGGRAWSPVPDLPTNRWTSADFLGRQQAVAALASGSIASVSGLVPGEPRPATVRAAPLAQGDRFDLRKARAVRFADPRLGWLVGDGGLVLRSTDGGQTWQRPPRLPPEDVLRGFDFAALGVWQSHCWIAGTPGTRVLHSPDGGQTWTFAATGQAVGLTSLAFLDAQHGWAAGKLGRILHTNDGGRTWQVQRGGASRLAVLAVFSRPEVVPWELLVKLAANEGLRTRLHFVAAPTDAAAGDSPPRTHAAAVRTAACGADFAWQFPLPAAEVPLPAVQMLENWNAAHHGRALERLAEHLVQQIRLWRPEMVITHTALPDGHDPLGHLLHQMVLRAVEQAAVPEHFPRQISDGGLSPWKVKKVYGLLPEGVVGPVALSTAELAPAFDGTLAAAAAAARGQVDRQFRPAPAMHHFRLHLNTAGGSGAGQPLLAGLSLPAGGEARRRLEAAAASLEQTRRAAQQQRNLRAILAHVAADRQRQARLVGELGTLTEDLDARSAGEILYGLALEYHRRGAGELAAETMEQLVRRYPEHELTSAALVWLVRYWASGETAWRHRESRGAVVRQATVEIGPTNPAAAPTIPAVPGVPTIPTIPAIPAVPPQSPVETQPAQVLLPQHGAAMAVRFAQQLQRHHLALAGEPSVQFPLAAAYRQSGAAREAQRLWLGLRRGPADSVWRDCAGCEAWLENSGGDPPKAVCRARRTASRPLLDGKLDEPLWREARPLPLRSPRRDDASWPAAVLIAYDEEYLYLAGECRRAPGAAYRQADQPRRRDADLSAEDRVEFLLDIDRDWTTYWRLVVDHRGWAAESCWGDSTWDPQWHIAAGGQGEVWRFEAAIAWKELAPQPPQPGDSWALGVQRVAAEAGFQSWTRPAAPLPRGEGFGLLRFE